MIFVKIILNFIYTFVENIKNVWENDISANILNNLVSSMPKRIEEVIKAKGGQTKY